MKLINIIFLLCLVSSNTFALTISTIEVKGNSKTKTQVIIDELLIPSLSETSIDEIERGVSNLRNTKLFSEVSYRIEVDKLHITVSEKWTTIPVLKFRSGGGVAQTTIGVYDPHVFGNFTELGAQYQRLGKTNSAVAWFKKPRLIGKRMGIDIQLWELSRLRTKYEQESKERTPKTGFLHSRTKFYIALTKEVSNDLEAKLFYEYNHDRFSDRLVPSEVPKVNNKIVLPPSSLYHFIGGSIDFGRVNSRQHLVDGSLFKLKVRGAISNDKNLKDFLDGDLSFYYYKTLSDKATFAQRFLGGATTTKVLQYWWYLGGLDRIRGFADNRFAGRYYWLSNTELRYPAYYSKDFIVQPAAFLDIVSVSEKTMSLDEFDGASTGVGLRVIFPKIYRFVGRIDYAKTIVARDSEEISLGVQQFF